LLAQNAGNLYRLITPKQHAHRGCQLSIQTKRNGKKLFEQMTNAGIIADWREPDVIRVAPVPLYNTFIEVYNFTKLFSAMAAEKNKSA
jgi:kynureninase